MFSKIILVLLFSGCCFAWLRPERCLLEQTHSRLQRRAASSLDIPVKFNITEEVEQTKRELADLYRDYNFSKNPVKAREKSFRKIRLYGPLECSLNTAAEKLTSFVCQPNLGCSITHAVATVDTYTALEGYNWGVKVSPKWTIVEKVFEVGGEVSVGGSYSCSFSKGKTTTETVQCAKPLTEHGRLDLYNIKTQMVCAMGTYITQDEERQGKHWHIFKNLTENEYHTILNNVIPVTNWYFTYILDTDNVPELLLDKLKKDNPLYNPNTDIISTYGLPKPQIGMDYYKIIETNKEYVQNVPFTNKQGDMHHTYVCTFTPR